LCCLVSCAAVDNDSHSDVNVNVWICCMCVCRWYSCLFWSSFIY